MKKVFIGLSGGAGPMIRCLPIAIELKKRGYQIEYYSTDYSSYYMDMYGFRRVLVSYPRKQNQGTGLTNKWTDLEHFASTYENDSAYFESKYSCWVEYMKQVKPDLILSDFSLGSAISGLILDIPIISISQSCYLYPIKNGTIRWWDHEKKPEECHILKNLNCFLKKYNKKTYNIFEEVFLENKVFLPSIPEFDSLEGMQDKVTYIGPILWEGAVGETAVLEKKKSNRARIFVYTGLLNDACGDTGILIYRAMKEAAKELDIDFVFSNGNFQNIKDPGLKNTSVSRGWMSIKEIYSSFDLVVHHGGHNSCLGSLVYGTPSYIVPTHTEREFNARKMQEMGTAKMILPEELEPKKIIEDIQDLLQNSWYRKQCAVYQNIIKKRGLDGKSLLADAIEKEIGL